MTILTVSQLNRYISFKLKEDKNLHGILIRGEISNFTNHTKTGHLYFSLKDGSGSVKAIMFNNYASRLQFEPSNGMSVIISASVQVYERDGQYQLYVTDIQPDGIGTAYLSIEQLKAKLLEEGIFDNEHKVSLPAFPENIGIVTSPDAAALQDILNIIARRYPIARITVFPCLVQGVNAPETICSALERADQSGMDVIIVGRGGGSVEDLSAFNSEAVARKLYSCVTPVISAVGHETDTSISDYAADLRAPTPSAAAELAVPDISTLIKLLQSAEFTLNKRFSAIIDAKKSLVDNKEARLGSLMPKQKIITTRRLIDEKKHLLDNVFKNSLSVGYSRLAERAAALEQLSPLKIMSRGYSIIYKDDKIVSSSAQLNEGDKITIRLADGEAAAEIKCGKERS